VLALPDLQRAFFRAVTAACGAHCPEADLIAEVRGDGRLDARARLDVYARMYCARLLDVLFEDYPRVAAIIGEDEFASLAHDYIAIHCSTDPSLRWFGRRFPDFLAERAAHSPSFLSDLARLEWTRLGVFDAGDAPTLTVDRLRELAPEAWATLRLQLIPAFEVLRAAWPVHRIWDADAAEPASAWQPDETWLRVWRRDDLVYQASMDATERAALAHVQAGDDFGTLCDGLTALVSQEDAAGTAGALLLRWIEDGVLRPAASAA
jgi:hypothetical protein